MIVVSSHASLAANASSEAPGAANDVAIKPARDGVYRDVSAGDRGREGRIQGVRFGRMAQVPWPRAALAALLAAVLVTGAIAARIGSQSCQRGGSKCGFGRVIRWSRMLPGSWNEIERSRTVILGKKRSVDCIETQSGYVMLAFAPDDRHKSWCTKNGE